jgi:hypothetical protein
MLPILCHQPSDIMATVPSKAGRRPALWSASTRELPTVQAEHNARKQGQSCFRTSPSPAKDDLHRNPWHPFGNRNDEACAHNGPSADAFHTSLGCEAESEFSGRAEAFVHQPRQWITTIVVSNRTGPRPYDALLPTQCSLNVLEFQDEPRTTISRLESVLRSPSTVTYALQQGRVYLDASSSG